MRIAFTTDPKAEFLCEGSSMSEISSTRWWREREVAWLVALVLGAYFLRVDLLPVFGEEPRRALIAREMTDTGDWIVPRTQGILRSSRPPLQNWMIVIASFLTGSFDAWAIRLPSLLCMLATVLMIYGYSRTILNRLSAFAAAACYATMLQVLEFGRLGETEAVFTLFVAGSLMLWHWGWSQGWSPAVTWSVGYSFAALGLLTKGLQAPIYFIGAIGLYLLVTGQWRALFTTGHLVGIFAGLAVFGLWLIPFAYLMGVANTWNIFFWNVACRFEHRDPIHFVIHALRYPWELLLLALFPWTALLAPFVSHSFRKTLDGPKSDAAKFLWLASGYAFIFVWLPPDSRTRYYMPLYPCLAVLMGMSIEQIVLKMKRGETTPLWDRGLMAWAFGMSAAAVVVPAIALLAPTSRLSLPLDQVAPYAVASFALAVLAWKSSKGERSERRFVLGLMSIVAFVSITYVGPVLTIQSRRCENIGQSVAGLKERLPPNVQLVSLGQTHHAFAHYYGRHIPVIPWTPADKSLDPRVDYFCVHLYGDETFSPSFAWQEIDSVICDRLHRPVPLDRVIIGRRIDREASVTVGHMAEGSEQIR